MSGEKVRPHSRSEPPGGWTRESLDTIFFGSLIEGVSNFTDKVFASYLEPAKENPLSPLPPLRRQSRTLSGSLLPFPDLSVKMGEDRCSRCHRFKKNPPTTEVSHVGSKGESLCKLDYHPEPFDYVDETGNACAHSYSEKIVEENALGDKVASQALEMQQLKFELLEMKRQQLLLLLLLKPLPQQPSPSQVP